MHMRAVPPASRAVQETLIFQLPCVLVCSVILVIHCSCWARNCDLNVVLYLQAVSKDCQTLLLQHRVTCSMMQYHCMTSAFSMCHAFGFGIRYIDKPQLQHCSAVFLITTAGGSDLNPDGYLRKSMVSSFHCSPVFLEQTCVTTKLLLAMKGARMRGFRQPSISFLVVLLPGCLTGMLSTHGRQQNEIHILHSNTSNSNLRHSASKKLPSSSSRCLVACLHPLDLWHLPSASVLFFAAPVLAATRVPGFHP